MPTMKTFSVAGDRVAILLDGTDTAQAYSVMELTAPPGGGPPPHIHFREDETFLVLSGEITVLLDAETIVLKQGGFATAPRGIPHHYKNTGATEARILCTSTPAGIEKFFETAGVLLPGRDAPPVPFTTEAKNHMIAIAPDFGIEILRPK
jgi:quercetin dioxygenase-like cupin family protein